MNYEEAVNYLQSLRRFGIKLGNDRISELMRMLGSPQNRYRIAHVAGTKGKGSTTVMIASILRASGFHVGGYYSPYVYDLCERVQVDGQNIPREDFTRLVNLIKPLIDDLRKTPYGSCTEFELKTAIGLKYFAERGVDYAAIEVGIGGRLDATNIVASDVGVITNIGLDHTQILGDTLAKIASEKAGIIKNGVPIITAADKEEALTVIRNVAKEKESPLTFVTASEMPEGVSDPVIRVLKDGSDFSVQTPSKIYTNLRLSLTGEVQRLNAACAVGAVEQLSRKFRWNIAEEAVRDGLLKAWLPGRMQKVHSHPDVILDGAHNQLAAGILANEIANLKYKRLLLVVGMVSGHDPEGVLEPLASLAYKVYATQPLWTRGLNVTMIAETARRYCPRVERVTPPLEAAKRAVQEANEEDLVLVTGSFYTVGDVRPWELFPSS
jgi:dihydrofolate synthase/folylpolyglutamate synthase